MTFIIPFLLLFLLASCANEVEPAPVEISPEAQPTQPVKPEQVVEAEPEPTPEEIYAALKQDMIQTYSERIPVSWGEQVPGVLTHIDTEDKVVALTFDACDGSLDSYDHALMEFLIDAQIPATLFVGGQWIEAYEDEFMALADNDLFEIANHGYLHQPLSVNGQSAYGIPGTEDIAAAFDEIYFNQVKIEELIGEMPRYFRAGTAYYDEVAVEMANELGVKVVNYNSLGDAGGTFNHEQIVSTLEQATPGAIYLFHMNQPQSAIASGVQEGVRLLQEQGYQFVQLRDYDAQLSE